MLNFTPEITPAHPGNLSFFLYIAYRIRSTAVVCLLLWLFSCIWIEPARADGGGPQPTNTPLPGAQSAPVLLLTSTPEVKTFEIIIDPNQNATVQPVTPENQAILSRSEALDAQVATPVKEEEFSSPLWVFGFFAVVIVILVLNSVSRGIRNRE